MKIRSTLLVLFAIALFAGTSSAITKEDLAQDVARILDASAVRGANVGVMVRDAQGSVIFEKDARVPRIPASNMKLVTTACALDLLREVDPDFKFETVVRAVGAIEGEVLKGDLHLFGGGDPNLSARFSPDDPLAAFKDLAGQVRRTGIAKVIGQLVIHGEAFGPEFVHPSWPRDQLSEWYEAPVSSIAFNDNCVDVKVLPPRREGEPVTVEQTLSYYPVVNRCVVTSNAREHSVWIDLDRENKRIIVGGKIFSQSAGVTKSLAVVDPLDYAGAAFKSALASSGIMAEGGVRLVSSGPFDTNVGVEVASYASPLGQTIEITNKNSQNFYAECLLRTLGRYINTPLLAEASENANSRGESAAMRFFAGIESVQQQPRTNDLRRIQMTLSVGSNGSGRTALRRILTSRLGIEIPEGVIFDDGSGMSRNSRLSADFVCSLLSKMSAGEREGEFFGSLSSMGVSGTLKSRGESFPTLGSVLGKTGTLNSVSSLSGAVSIGDKIEAYFSVLVNDYPGSAGAVKDVQDQIASKLTAYVLDSITGLAGGGNPWGRIPPGPEATIEEFRAFANVHGEIAIPSIIYVASKAPAARKKEFAALLADVCETLGHSAAAERYRNASE
ncbi:MAG: D-alanyl-D-alanine carboxypeptidase/D-alanyl-D-alanine-endopeptidase [Planctomycetes bacterium]|nr:D-alanyl-D-alanine carboxypeptidase/D-alanyl-D-alanine-endopeptidase [Planctomycetota bacterium]